jgi:Immunity protein 42
MVIGEKSSFAIEFETDENSGGAWLFGKFCYWVGGSMLGDYQLGTSLRDVFFQMTQTVGDCGNRFTTMWDASGDEMFNAMNESIYGTHELVDLAGRFDVLIPVDVFDGVRIFLLDRQGEASRLLYSRDGGIAEERLLALGEFDRVFKRCYDELRLLYEAAESD